jgi:hypothetical protein
MQLHLPSRFLPVSVCVTQVSVGGRGSEGAGLYYRPLTARYDSAHTSQRLAAISHGCGQFHPQILWANSPTLVRHRLCKTAVNVRVKTTHGFPSTFFGYMELFCDHFHYPKICLYIHTCREHAVSGFIINILSTCKLTLSRFRIHP